jgi:hypothetical protein
MSGAAMLMLAGGGGVSLSNHTLNATFQLASDGTANAVMTGNSSSPPNGTTPYVNEWLRGGLSSGYEARATLNSGTLSSGTTGAWLVLSTTRSWSCAATRGSTGSSSQTANLTIEIRSVATGLVLDSATITLTATAEFEA